MPAELFITCFHIVHTFLVIISVLGAPVERYQYVVLDETYAIFKHQNVIKFAIIIGTEASTIPDTARYYATTCTRAVQTDRQICRVHPLSNFGEPQNTAAGRGAREGYLLRGITVTSSIFDFST
jgi:hypothetical protein